jgi:hypothetical protein
MAQGGPLHGLLRFEARYDRSYTRFMKTAISIPDSLFEEADRLAKSRGWSRSELYANAVTAYVNSRDFPVFVKNSTPCMETTRRTRRSIRCSQMHRLGPFQGRSGSAAGRDLVGIAWGASGL